MARVPGDAVHEFGLIAGTSPLASPIQAVPKQAEPQTRVSADDGIGRPFPPHRQPSSGHSRPWARVSSSWSRRCRS